MTLSQFDYLIDYAHQSVILKPSKCLLIYTAPVQNNFQRLTFPLFFAHDRTFYTSGVVPRHTATSERVRVPVGSVPSLSSVFVALLSRQERDRSVTQQARM